MTDLTDSDLQCLLAGVLAGDAEASNRFCVLHFDRLTSLARNRMSQRSQRVRDCEDIALSAVHSFLVGVSEQRFQMIRTKNELWSLLTTIVARKIAKQYRHEGAQRRGGGHVRGESAFDSKPDADSSNQGLAQVAVSHNTPDLEVEFLDTCEHLFNALDDETMKSVARLVMEGYSIDDIAEELGCVRRTVERKLQRIRALWTNQMPK